MIKEYGIKTAKYALLPGLFPRISEVFFGGFSSISYIMAILFVMVGLLPSGHPALRSEGFGKYGIRKLFAEAADRIIIKKENIDQILIFTVLLVGFVLIFMQLLAIIFGFIISSADATMPSWSSFFVTDNTDTDVAYMLLDQIFGIPDFFNTKYSTDLSIVFPSKFHIAMQAMFAFYSNAILMVGILIVVYYMFVVVAETAQTGIPFGERFASIYAPFRLILAIALMIPLNYGYNGAQYLILHAAKWGSSLGTNSWLHYNSTVTDVIGLSNDRLVAKINTPTIGYLIEFMHIIKVCDAYYKTKQIDINPYLVKLPDPQNAAGVLEITGAGDFSDALDFYKGGFLTITFGELDPKYTTSIGNVNPYCGSVVIDINTDINLVAVRQITETYYDIILHLWQLPEGDLFAQRVLGAFHPDVDGCSIVAPGPNWGWTTADDGKVSKNGGTTCNFPVDTYFDEIIKMYQIIFNASADVAIANQKIDKSGLTLTDTVARLGWGGAGIWFNNLAKINSSIAQVTVNIPRVVKYPSIMEEVLRHKLGTEVNIASITRFDPVSVSGDIYDPAGEGTEFDVNAAMSFYHVLTMFEKSKLASGGTITDNSNVLEVIVDMILGGSGIMDIRSQRDVHPLAQLSSIGSGLINQTIRHLFGAFIGSAMGELLNSKKEMGNSEFGKMVGTMFSSFATITFTLGFLLGYVLPLVPFMYFFFAVSRWVKSIFEAMVAAPLWALAHLAIDGDGIPGQAASQGYFLVLEIFLRPILTIFGLLAALAVFEAMTSMLYVLFDVIITNALGYNPNDATPDGLNMTVSVRRGMDELYFTILYTIMMYVLALTSFKLIDAIPQNTIRWLGSSAKAFGDNEDAMESLTKYASISTAMYVAPALSKGALTAGSGVGASAAIAMKDDTAEKLKNSPK